LDVTEQTRGEEKMQVAKEILNQLGGHKFTVITGSSKYVAGENYLRMDLA